MPKIESIVRRIAVATLFASLPAISAEAGVTLVHAWPLELKEARIEGLTALPFEKGLLQGTGSVESPVVEAEFPFVDLVASFNADTPSGSSIEMEAQVRVEGKWTKWYRLARWEPGAPRSFDKQSDRFGKVAVDTLVLKRPATAFRYRVKMLSAGVKEARLRRVAVTYSDTKKKTVKKVPWVEGPWAREIKLSPRSQKVEDPAIASKVCSPTSLSMILERWGVKRTTAKIAEIVQDRNTEIYWNWPLNIAAAASFGLSGQVARFESLFDLQEEIAAGRPVVASVTYKKGDLDNSPINATSGHLLVVAGFTKKGDVIVYDPAAKPGGVRRVYKRSQFEKVWLRNKHGLVYQLGPRFPQVAVVGVPTADLRQRPRQTSSLKAMDKGRLSQLLYGEHVKILEAKGDWVRVKALEQPHREGKEAWSGYPGWVRADALAAPPVPYRPTAVIRLKRAELRWRDAQGLEEVLTLPMGAALRAEPSEGPRTKVRLLEGRTAEIDSAALWRLEVSNPKPVDRRDVVEAAATFLGDSYVWGGRSSQQLKPGWGVDCSGLVHLAYRSVGMTVPRDAHTQFEKAKAVKRAKLQPGDLIFLTESARSKKVDHVMLYTGGDGILESRSGVSRTIRTTFTERFGASLDSIESGNLVTDLTRRKPAQRRIHFGSLL
jgi:cell wall-associated NlpC family hydrolase